MRSRFLLDSWICEAKSWICVSFPRAVAKASRQFRRRFQTDQDRSSPITRWFTRCSSAFRTRSQRCRKEEGRALSVGSIQAYWRGKASFCPLWTRTLYPPPRWICRACFYLSWRPLAFSLPGDGANALNCFTRDCETRETGLEGALRCSELAENGEGMASIWKLDTRMYAAKEVRPFFFSSTPLRCSPRCLFQSLSPLVKYFWAETTHVSPFPPVKIEVSVAERTFFHFSIENW